jgi:hypothetical protein
MVFRHCQIERVAEQLFHHKPWGTHRPNDGEQRFVKDFVNSWVKVMNLDRFDLKDAK